MLMNKLMHLLIPLMVLACAYIPFRWLFTDRVDLFYKPATQEVSAEDGWNGSQVVVSQWNDEITRIKMTREPGVLRYLMFSLFFGVLCYWGFFPSWRKPQKKALMEVELKYVKSHPSYAAFIMEDPEREHLYKEQTAEAFYTWLEQQE